MNYFNIFGLQNIYLEDSFVLAINESSEEIIFLMMMLEQVQLVVAAGLIWLDSVHSHA